MASVASLRRTAPLGCGRHRDCAPGAPMSNVLQLAVDHIKTPIGELLIVSDEEGNLRAVDWKDYDERMNHLLRLHYGENGFKLGPARAPNGSAKALKNYFAGEISAINMLPVQTAGTPFQREVWQALRKIP